MFNFFCLHFRKHLSLFTFKQGKGSKKVNWAIAFCWSKFTKSRQLVFLMIWNMPFKSSNCQVLYSNFEIILLFDHQDLIHMSPNSCYYFFYLPYPLVVEGGKFLQKKWCCVGGGITRYFDFINWVDNVNWPMLRVSKTDVLIKPFVRANTRRYNTQHL